MHALVCYGQRADTAARHSTLILDVKSHDGREAVMRRCAKDGGQQCEQSANSLQLLERPLHGESKFVRQSA